MSRVALHPRFVRFLVQIEQTFFRGGSSSSLCRICVYIARISNIRVRGGRGTTRDERSEDRDHQRQDQFLHFGLLRFKSLSKHNSTNIFPWENLRAFLLSN